MQVVTKTEFSHPQLVVLAEFYSEWFLEEFVPWFKEQPSAFFEFDERVKQILERGYNHYSSRTIIETLRFHSDTVSGSGTRWKNASTPDIGRLYALVYPERALLFDYVRDGGRFLRAVAILKANGYPDELLELLYG